MTAREDDIKLAYAAFAVFADDGKLDMDELDGLLAMALSHGGLSENEKRVLRNLFEHLDAHDLDPAVREKIEEIRALHRI